MAGRPVSSKGGGGGEAAMAKQLVQSLRGDLNSLSNEARKKYPAVREHAERGGMYLKTKSESKGFSIQVLASSDDVVHPLLYACDTKSPVIVKIALSAIQKLIQYKAIPQMSVESIVSSVGVLMESGVEELKVLQTILLLVTTTDVVQGKPLAKVLHLCFKMYGSRDQNLHNTAGVVIRQIVSSMFERLNSFISSSGSFDWGGGQDSAHAQLPVQASDAYLLFQDICFLTNGDPPAWLPPTLELELTLGLELLESVLRTHPRVFTKEKLFNQLLTERVCPLVVKLFSPSSKYRQSPPPMAHSPTSAALLSLDKPTFGLSVRLLRILNVLIREFYFSLVTQCEIFLSMLVKFLDSDKPMWQRTLAIEILHAFCNQPDLLRSFCESYDMQEHSSKIFGDIVDALGSFIQSFFTSHVSHFPFSIAALSSSSSSSSTSSSSATSVTSGGVAGGPNGGHVTGSQVGSGRHLHQFSVKGSVLTVEPLPAQSHNKPICLEMLDKFEVPPIPEGYPLVVAMNALLDAVRSVSIIINGKDPGSGKLKRAKPSATPTLGELADRRDARSVAATTPRGDSSSELRHGGGVALPTELSLSEKQVECVMVQSSWSGVLAALALLLDACMDERTTTRLLKAHQTFILLCGQLQMMSPRDAFLTSLCKGTLPPRYTMSLIAQRKATPTPKTSTSATPTAGLPPHMMPSTKAASSPSSSAMPLHTSTRHAHRHPAPGSAHDHHLQDAAGDSHASGHGISGAGGGARRKLNLSESGGSLPGEGTGGVVAPSPMKEQQSGLVTVKNLQCIHTLLQVVHHQGNLLDSAWFLVMKTLQLVVEVFGCVHVPGGGYKEIAVAEISSLALLCTSKKDDVAALTDKLIGVFRASRELREDAVLKMIDALSQLLLSSMPASGTSKESHLFPVAALQEVGGANVARLDVVWEPVTSQLSEICCHNDTNLRCFAAEALMALIKGALEDEKNKKENEQLVILSPLKSLVQSQHVDVRLKQLDCISQVLHSSGQSLGSSWSVILDVVRSATQIQSESVVRSGFQSLQLVTADFLPAIPHTSLATCVDMSGQYGLQTVDINISLTSIGLLWNLADYLFQNKDSLKANLSHAVFDSIWMQLFKHLSDLCVDERAAVRKSACQTLFSTISAHGTLLQKNTWKDVLWKILFPLLDGVAQATGSASTSSFQTSLLIHHSRNTEQKQWAETQVLTLTGSARLIQSRWSILSDLEGFMEAWSTFLGMVKECALSSTSEVSLAAMKCLVTIVEPQTTSTSSPRNSLSPGNAATPNTSPTKGVGNQDQQKRRSHSPSPVSTLGVTTDRGDQVDGGDLSLPVWFKAWEVWSAIGEKLVSQSMPSTRQLKEVRGSGRSEDQVLRTVLDSAPSQALLVGLLEAILQIYPHIHSTFTETQYHTLSAILRGCLLLPVPRDVSPFLVPSHSEHALSSLQRLVLRCIGGVVTTDDIIKSKNDQSEDPVAEGRLVHTMFGRKKTDHVSSSHEMSLATPPSSPLINTVLQDLLSFSSYAHTPPDQGRLLKSFPSAKSQLMNMNFVPFGLSCQALAVQLYRACVKAGAPGQLPVNMHVDMLQALHPPLKCRYSVNDQQPPQRAQPHPSSSAAPPTSIWLHTVEALLLVLADALPLNLGKDDASVALFWTCLGDILEDFLFCEIPEGFSVSSEKIRENEEWDIKLIELIKRDILSSATPPPPRTFLERLASLLNKGSIHASTDQFNGGENHSGSTVQLRENFARACFEALLQFSFMQNKDSTLASDSTGQVALNALLERCDEVLKRFVEDERLSGSCPLPRTRMNEVSLVLKSVTILISALKKAQQSPSATVDAGMWAYVTRLYPALVQCVTCKSYDVRVSLKEALGQFSELLQPSALQHKTPPRQ